MVYASALSAAGAIARITSSNPIVSSVSAGKLIERCFPAIHVQRCKRILTGWDDVVFDVNGEYIFRFPRFRDSEGRLRKEMGFLSVVSRYLSVRVPNYEFLWRGDRDNPHTFGGYRKINGVPMTVGGYRIVWTGALGGELAGLLKELHGLAIPKNQLRKIPRHTPRVWLNRVRVHLRQFRRVVYPLLDGETRHHFEMLSRDMLADFEKVDFEPTLIHGDLSSRNILIDPVKLKVTGILDWSDARISDPALDFSHLFEINWNLGEQILKMYDREKSGFESRIDWYVMTEPFYEVMWGVEHGLDEAKTQGLRRLRRRILSQDTKRL